MKKDIIAMSTQEIKRLKIINKIMDRQLTQVKAGEVLGISDRHVRRLVKRVREEGARGLVHRNRGKPPPNKISEEREVKKEAVEPVKKKSKYIPPADHPWRRHNPSLHHNCYLERI